MSSAAPPSENFKLSMLLSDTRYRGMSLQVITFIIFMAVFFWLVELVVKRLSSIRE